MNGAFFNYLPLVLGLSFVGFIALGVAAVQDGKHVTNRSEIVRRGYIYLVSFATLRLVALSVGNLADLGLRAGVFTQADPVAESFEEAPPALYFSTIKESPTTVLACETDCTLTTQDRSDIERWVASFQDWKERRAHSNVRAQAVVTPLSFLVITGIVFLFHWRFVRRDRQQVEGGANLTRSTYFASMSFIWLITTIVTAGMALNTGLRSVIPGASQPQYRSSIAAPYPLNDGLTGSLITCGEKCGVDAETVVTAQEWKTEMDAWNERHTGTQQTSRDTHNGLSMQLAFFIVALPLFALHFKTWWKEKKPATPGAA